MIEVIEKDWAAKVVVILFTFFTLWWIVLKLTTKPENLYNQLFAATYGVIALWGAIWGLSSSQKWGGSKSIMGRSILMFALGLFAQEFGQLIYSYYIYFARIDVPYPSLGDIGYFGSIPLYVYAAYLLARASGIKIYFRSFKRKTLAATLPLLLLVSSYFFFLQGYEFSETSLLTILLDFGYPLGQAIYVSVALLAYILSKNILGGIMRNKILFILFALIVQYFCDFVFLYQALNETWYAGGFNDYMYLTSYMIMSLGLFQLKTTAVKLNSSK